MWTHTHLFQRTDDESQRGKDVEVWWSCRDTADNRLNHQCRHERFLSPELVRQKPEQDGAKHDAKVEYHLRRLRQNVPVAHEVPLAQNSEQTTNY